LITLFYYLIKIIYFYKFFSSTLEPIAAMEHSYKRVCEFWDGEQVAYDRFYREILINKKFVSKMIAVGTLEDGEGDQFYYNIR
jgi:hypothetical protein